MAGTNPYELLIHVNSAVETFKKKLGRGDPDLWPTIAVFFALTTAIGMPLFFPSQNPGDANHLDDFRKSPVYGFIKKVLH